MSITIVKPGLFTTIQDAGRYGYQHLGVPVSGAMDIRAHRLANLIAGNTADQATLECTLMGPTLQFSQACCIALSGADMDAHLNGQAIPNNRPIIIRAGDTLALKQAKHGVRTYLAIYGGFACEPVMGSTSTYIRGGFGGYEGRALQANDILTPQTPLTDTAKLDTLSEQLWDQQLYLPAPWVYQAKATLRAIRGPQAVLFTEEAVAAFFSAEYRIDPQSDRMGYRLSGPTLDLAAPTQILSEAASFGSIQVPADGQPIVLMADRQTTGGYPKIAHVCTVDLPQIAQAAPGQTLSFRPITLEQAQQLDQQREQAYKKLVADLAQCRKLLHAAHL